MTKYILKLFWTQIKQQIPQNNAEEEANPKNEEPFGFWQFDICA